MNKIYFFAKNAVTASFTTSGASSCAQWPAPGISTKSATLSYEPSARPSEIGSNPSFAPHNISVLDLGSSGSKSSGIGPVSYLMNARNTSSAPGLYAGRLNKLSNSSSIALSSQYAPFSTPRRFSGSANERRKKLPIGRTDSSVCNTFAPTPAAHVRFRTFKSRSDGDIRTWALNIFGASIAACSVATHPMEFDTVYIGVVGVGCITVVTNSTICFDQYGNVYDTASLFESSVPGAGFAPSPKPIKSIEYTR